MELSNSGQVWKRITATVPRSRLWASRGGGGLVGAARIRAAAGACGGEDDGGGVTGTGAWMAPPARGLGTAGSGVTAVTAPRSGGGAKQSAFVYIERRTPLSTRTGGAMGRMSVMDRQM